MAIKSWDTLGAGWEFSQDIREPLSFCNVCVMGSFMTTVSQDLSLKSQLKHYSTVCPPAGPPSPRPAATFCRFFSRRSPIQVLTKLTPAKQHVMYGRGTRSRPGSGRIVNVYSRQKSEARLSEFGKAHKHKAESLIVALVVTISSHQ